MATFGKIKNSVPKEFMTIPIHDQGRIKVRWGPRLDTVMGPYPSFTSYEVIID